MSYVFNTSATSRLIKKGLGPNIQQATLSCLKKCEGSQCGKAQNLKICWFLRKKKPLFHDDNDDELFWGIVDRRKPFRLISIHDHRLDPPHRKSLTRRQQNLNLSRT